MDVKEVRMKKVELEEAIQTLVDQFEKETDTEVKLSLGRYSQINGNCYTVVNCEVNLR